jgi:alpha-glucosidase
MNRYRDFETDPVNYSIEAGQSFLERLHDSGRHYVPIIDSAIYAPNPMDPSDA